MARTLVHPPRASPTGCTVQATSGGLGASSGRANVGGVQPFHLRNELPLTPSHFNLIQDHLWHVPRARRYPAPSFNCSAHSLLERCDDQSVSLKHERDPVLLQTTQDNHIHESQVKGSDERSGSRDLSVIQTWLQQHHQITMATTQSLPKTQEGSLARNAIRRSVTVPTKLQPTDTRQAVVEIGAAEGIETLFVHPSAKVVSFTTSSASIASPSRIPANSGEQGTLPWTTPAERTLAAGEM